jgi:hypothetical protein
MYTYSKKLALGEARAATVEVCLLVKQRVKKWPERRGRQLSWVSTQEGGQGQAWIDAVLRQLMEFEHDLTNPPLESLPESRPRGRA